MYNTETTHKKHKHKDFRKRNPEKSAKAVISLALSVININLAASLALWTKSCGRLPLVLFYGAGTVVCFLLLWHYLQIAERRLKVHSLLWGIPVATSHVLGCLLRRDGTALHSLSRLPWLLMQILCLAVLAAACIAPCLRFCQNAGRKQQTDRQPRTGRPAWQIWLCSTVLILLGWIPVFLAYYPSVFAYDAEGQLYQVLAHDYSTHHPLLHTLFLGAFFRLGGSLPGSYPAGMAIHSVVQMLLMAAAFGYTLAWLAKRNVPFALRTGLLLFYALFPTNSVLALSTTKDVLFSALVLLATLSVCEMADGTKDSFQRRDWIRYVLFTTGMLLFRNNALYALLLSLPVLCFLLRAKKKAGRVSWRSCLAFTVLALVLSVAGNLALKTTLGAQNGSPREMLSIPLQQMARTRVKAEESLPPEMRQTLDRYIPSEWVFAAYNPYLADPVKNRAVIHDDPAGLIKTWIRLGLEHPQIYIDAFLETSVGYWFLEDRSHAQIYGLGSESGFGYLSTDTRTMPAGCEIPQQSLLPGLRAVMEQIVSDNSYQNIPILRLLFAPAFYWWLLCLYMCYYLTLLLSPAVLVRYMYPFVVTAPVLFCCLFRRPRTGGSIHEKV